MIRDFTVATYCNICWDIRSYYGCCSDCRGVEMSCEDEKLECEYCDHCLPIGEGDHICDKMEFRLSSCLNTFLLKIICIAKEKELPKLQLR